MAAGNRRLSTGETIQVAKARFLQLSSQHRVDVSKLKHFFDASQFNLSGEEIKDVELLLLLLAAAHKLASKQLDQSVKFLSWCQFLSSATGTSVQRLVHYFTKSLQEKIDKESGIKSNGGGGWEELAERQLSDLNPTETSSCSNPALIACSLQLPHVQVTQFAGIQTVAESVATAKRVRLIDLAIRSGGHCTVLMQALANRQSPIEMLTVTAVVVTGKLKSSEQRIEETGKRLASFAETLNIPLRFNYIIVPTVSDLTEEMFDIGDGETVAVYARNILRNVRAETGSLESLIRVLRNLNPCAIVVTELEANHDSAETVDRFEGAMSTYGAVFDCLEDCLDRQDGNRRVMESTVGQEIRDVLAAEAVEERVFRHMRVEEWRDYFGRVGMVEMEISRSSFYQAALLLRNFSSGESCTVDRDGKCLVTGWKGTPLHSVSAWKFYRQVPKRPRGKKYAA
ncbi:DELLA protein RGL2 [Linum grandiflorum]